MNNASETTCKFDLWLPHLCAPIHTCRHAHTDVHTHIREKEGRKIVNTDPTNCDYAKNDDEYMYYSQS